MTDTWQPLNVSSFPVEAIALVTFSTVDGLVSRSKQKQISGSLTIMR
jgi:hypothetical protein